MPQNLTNVKSKVFGFRWQHGVIGQQALPEPMLTQIYVSSLEHNDLLLICIVKSVSNPYSLFVLRSQK